MCILGRSLVGQKRFDEAEPLLLEAFNELMAREEHIPAHATARLTEAQDAIIQIFVEPGDELRIAVAVYDWFGTGGIFRPVTLSIDPLSTSPLILKTSRVRPCVRCSGRVMLRVALAK